MRVGVLGRIDVNTSILTSLLGDPIFLVLFLTTQKLRLFFYPERAIIYQESILFWDL